MSVIIHNGEGMSWEGGENSKDTKSWIRLGTIMRMQTWTAQHNAIFSQ